MKVRIVMIIIYLVIIRSVVRNDFSVSRRRLSSFRVVILAMSSIFR